MTTALVVGQLVLAVVFVLAGLNKFVRPDPEIRGMLGPGYRPLAVVELAAAVALVLPLAVAGPLDVLVPLVALGLGLMMIAAGVVNVRLGRRRDLGVNVVLLAVATAVGLGALAALG
jgi:hypothetical protein